MNTIVSGGRVQPANKIVLGTGLELSQTDDGDTIVNVSAGISSIGLQDANSGPDAATRLVFQGNVVSVDPGTGIATLDLDGRYQQLPPAGYSWLAGSNENRFTTPFGYISLGPQNGSFAHIYSTLPFYFNQELKVNGSTVWHSGNDGPASGLNADLLDSQHGAYYLAWANFTGVPAYATRWPTTTEVGLSRFVNAPVLGNSGPYGSVRITGSEGSYAGIQFADAAVTLMVYNASGVLRQGFYRYTSAPTVGWEWYFENGALTVGTVPWARLSGINQTLNTTDSPTFAALTVSGQIHAGGTALVDSGGALFVENVADGGYRSVLLNDLYLAARSTYLSSWLNQSVQTGASPTFFGAKVTDWFRNTTDATGLYNEANNYYWYSDSTIGRWLSRSLSGIELRDTNAITKGAVLFTALGFGLANSTLSWSVRCAPGGTGGQLYGTWLIDDPDVLNFGVSTRQMIDLYNSANGHQYGIGVQSATAYFRSGGGFAWFKGGSHVSSPANDPGTSGSVLAKLDANGYLYASRFYDIVNPGYYLIPSGTSVLYAMQINTKLNTISSVPITMDIAAGANRYPYIEWKYGGTRGAYMGWGTPGSQLDLTLENGNKLAIAGDVQITGALTKLRTGTTYDPVPIVIISNVAPTSSDVAPYGALWLVI